MDLFRMLKQAKANIEMLKQAKANIELHDATAWVHFCEVNFAEAGDKLNEAVKRHKKAVKEARL